MFSLAKAVSPGVEAHCPHWHSVLFQTLLQGVWLNSGARLWCQHMWQKLHVAKITPERHKVHCERHLGTEAGRGSRILFPFHVVLWACTLWGEWQPESLGHFNQSTVGLWWLQTLCSWTACVQILALPLLASCLQTAYLIFLLVHLWNGNCAYLVGC